MLAVLIAQHKTIFCVRRSHSNASPTGNYPRLLKGPVREIPDESNLHRRLQRLCRCLRPLRHFLLACAEECAKHPMDPCQACAHACHVCAQELDKMTD